MKKIIIVGLILFGFLLIFCNANTGSKLSNSSDSASINIEDTTKSSITTNTNYSDYNTSTRSYDELSDWEKDMIERYKSLADKITNDSYEDVITISQNMSEVAECPLIDCLYFLYCGQSSATTLYTMNHYYYCADEKCTAAELLQKNALIEDG